MAQKSGFFNAMQQGGVYDRTYNANDYTDNLAVVISNGVLRTINDDLKVTASGRTVSVAKGRAWIEGHYYYNDTQFTFAETQPPTGGSRIDRVILRLNNEIGGFNPTNERAVRLVYLQGTPANEPEAPAITRNETVHDLVLADIYVNANATSITVTDRRADANLCGFVYSNNKGYLFKRYNWEKTLNALTTTVQFDITQYNPDNCFLEIFVNGILESEGQSADYTLNGNIITFNGNLTAGTVVTVKCYRSIEISNVDSILDDFTLLQNKVAAIEGNGKYTYVCTGLNDNISLSQIAQAIISGAYNPASVTDAARNFIEAIGGSSYLSGLEVDTQISIDIIGKCGVSNAFAGDGTAATPFRWFSLGGTSPITKKIIFDFAKCEKIKITCAANSNNIVLFGDDLHIKNLNIKADGQQVGCNIKMIGGISNTGRINIESPRLEIVTTGSALIAEHGLFINPYIFISSGSSTAYCFKPKNTGLIRIIGGELYAYNWTNSGISSAIFHTSATDTDGVVIAENIHCPQVTKTNFSQGYLAVANAGNTIINGVVTRLSSSGTYATITGLVNKNKA